METQEDIPTAIEAIHLSGGMGGIAHPLYVTIYLRNG